MSSKRRMGKNSAPRLQNWATAKCSANTSPPPMQPPTGPSPSLIPPSLGPPPSPPCQVPPPPQDPIRPPPQDPIRPPRPQGPIRPLPPSSEQPQFSHPPLPTSNTGNDIRTMEYGRPLVSARTKKTVSQEEADPNLENKHVRGVVTGKELEDEVRTRGSRIKITWDEVTIGPSPPDYESKFVIYLGSIIRDKVEMINGYWGKVDSDSKERVKNKLETVFELDNHPKLKKWQDDHSRAIFKEWKWELHRHYKKHKQLGRDGTPRELQFREHEWAWLCEHFNSPKFTTASVPNKRNRANLGVHHQCGSKSYRRRLIKAVAEGAQVPAEKVYVETHAGHTEQIEKVQLAAREALKTLAKEKYPDVPDEDLDLREFAITDIPSQAEIMNTALPNKLGYYVNGLGSLGRGILKTSRASRFGGVSAEVLERAQQAEEELRQTREEVQQTKEELQKTKEDVSEYKKKLEDLQSQVSFLMSQFSVSYACQPNVAPSHLREDDRDDGNGGGTAHSVGSTTIDIGVGG